MSLHQKNTSPSQARSRNGRLPPRQRRDAELLCLQRAACMPSIESERKILLPKYVEDPGPRLA